MLASPMNNQHIMQRSEVVAEMRGHEQNKLAGELGHAADSMRKKDALKVSTVQKTENLELNPDAQKEGQAKQRRSTNQKKFDLLGSEEHDHPRKVLGGDHLDLLA